MVLDSGLWKEAVAAVDGRLIEELSRAEVTPERVMRLQSLLAMGALYRKYLEMVLQTGPLAAAQIEQERRSLLDKARGFVRAA